MNGYDGLLAAMPVSVAGGIVVGWLGRVSVMAGLVGGVILAGVLVIVSLFVVPPTG